MSHSPFWADIINLLCYLVYLAKPINSNSLFLILLCILLILLACTQLELTQTRIKSVGADGSRGCGWGDKIKKKPKYLVPQHSYANQFSVSFTFCISSANHNHQYLIQTKCRVMTVGVGTR